MTPHRENRPGDDWTDEVVLRESARWIHVPPAATRVEDKHRLLVLLPAAEGPSRVWRSWPARREAEALILETIDETRAAGGTRLVWQTGDGVSPPFMDALLAGHGFEKTEDLDVLAFELGAGPEPMLPDLRVPANVRVWPVEDATNLRRAHAISAAVFPASTPAEPDPETYFRMLSALKDRLPEPVPQEDLPRAFRSLASIDDPEDENTVPVATAGAELAGETLRLWGAGTLPEHRGCGAYRALVVERCRYAHVLGATLTLTKANTATSASLLHTAGFRSIATERRHTLNIPAASHPRP